MRKCHISQKLSVDAPVVVQHCRAEGVNKCPPGRRPRFYDLPSNMIGVNNHNPVALKDIRQRALARTNPTGHTKSLHKTTVVGRGNP